ncbi:MAG: hypothetical protein CL799_06205, partial [Chromatiales bacterium]|nr:hypothetical protein [Chromatiales bacterium]
RFRPEDTDRIVIFALRVVAEAERWRRAVGFGGVSPRESSDNSTLSESKAPSGDAERAASPITSPAESIAGAAAAIAGAVGSNWAPLP